MKLQKTKGFMLMYIKVSSKEEVFFLVMQIPLKSTLSEETLEAEFDIIK